MHSRRRLWHGVKLLGVDNIERRTSPGRPIGHHDCYAVAHFWVGVSGDTVWHAAGTGGRQSLHEAARLHRYQVRFAKVGQLPLEAGAILAWKEGRYETQLHSVGGKRFQSQLLHQPASIERRHRRLRRYP
jgi:hypothetical protein